MTEPHQTPVYDKSILFDFLQEAFPEEQVIVHGQFIEPVEYRYVRTVEGDPLLCVDSTIGFKPSVFTDAQSAMLNMGHDLHRMMFLNREYVSGEPTHPQNHSEYTPE